MKRRRMLVVSVVVGVMGGGIFAGYSLLVGGTEVARRAYGDAVVQNGNPALSSTSSYTTTVVPLTTQYCFECHGNGKKKGDFAIDSFKSVADLQSHKEQWEEALKDLRTGDMPPPTAKLKPTAVERKALIAGVEDVLNPYDPAHPNPGRVTLHRLNRAEYNNTIRDLLAVDLNVADDFPIDDAGYGFDNNGDVLSLSPMLMEKYITAAGLVLDKAIFADPVVPPHVEHWDAATLPGTLPTSDPKGTTPPGFNGRSSLLGRVMDYNSEIYIDYEFPMSGQYRFRLRSYGKQRPLVQFKVDGVNAGEPVVIPQDMPNVGVYGTDTLKISAGKHRVTLALVNAASKAEYDAAVAAAATRPAATAPAGFASGGGAPAGTAPATRQRPVFAGAPTTGPATAPGNLLAAGPAAGPGGNGANGANGARGGAQRGGAGGAAGRAGAGRGAAQQRQGRVAVPSITGKPTVGIVFVEAEGPLENTPDRMPESYKRVMVALPSESMTKGQAAEKIVRNFVPRAFRRPASAGEIAQLMKLWNQEDAAGDTFEASIHTTLQAVLSSPHFLYRYEQDPGAEDASGVRALDEFELASRLSYFLWSSMPDEELFNMARAGTLRANLEGEVRRMMKDPKSEAMVDNFAGQWLQLRQLGNASPDATRFPNFDEPLRMAMMKETQLFFTSIMKEDRSVLDFIDADYTFMNERLAKHYGRTDVSGDDFKRVSLAGTLRGGLLTQASILTITSYTNRTSPVLRGKWVLENLLDAAPPPPPPDVPKLVETAQAEMTGTLRQRMEQHRTNPNCISCHSQMDPIGFGLENFDAIGAWRDKDINGIVIDASGKLPDGASFDGAGGLKQILIARKDEFCRCLTNRMTTYALGRGLEAYDRPMVEQISEGLKKDHYKFSSLVMQIVESDAFQKRGAKRGEL